MGVSDAFGELTAVLEHLETADTEVKNVEIGEQMIGEGDEITAKLTVGVPVFADVDLHDGVSIRGENVDLEDQHVNIDLSVSLSVEELQNGHSSLPTSVGTSSETGSSTSVPAYKDPEMLQAVYDEYDTFPKMTEALDVDVTSETVRRYMVEYDIHDPDATRQVSKHTTPDQHDRNPSGGKVAGKNVSDGSDTSVSETSADETITTVDADQPENSVETGVSVTVTDEQPAIAGTGNSETVTGSSEGGASENSHNDPPESGNGDAPPSEVDDTSVAELLAETNSSGSDDSLIADGLGIPKGLTVSELTTIVNESNTVYEAKTQLGVDQDHARRLLKETALIDLVTQRLGADQISVSPREVRRRIDLNNSE
ncbi:hypothetical protein [Natrinema sp. 1APR25-10V2]|uniref:hypothetical protein n=1 Tax=Natrinema sp. 1APR25-10V2 TaxID=2951081 RepID=UPI0028749BC8|nr:hypothetical protein [Natrinema sp. 1APR25-10V2]MDS0477248.1 hypothetical protein [Natrinema sp. 1APR25-10V2]